VPPPDPFASVVGGALSLVGAFDAPLACVAAPVGMVAPLADVGVAGVVEVASEVVGAETDVPAPELAVEDGSLNPLPASPLPEEEEEEEEGAWTAVESAPAARETYAGLAATKWIVPDGASVIPSAAADGATRLSAEYVEFSMSNWAFSR
jgi:hypothetical protein